jgi:hypothetical protein
MAVLIVFGIRVVPLDMNWRAVAVAVYPVSFLALLFLVLLTGITHRPYRRSIWIITVAWCLAFGWYAWLSGSSPFVVHELHTFAAEAAASEVRRYYLVSIPLFVVLTLWFLSFPVVHRLELSTEKR